MTVLADADVFQIHDLVVDTGRRSVSRGDEDLPLPALSYRMLVALADAAPNVVSVDDLIENVWDGRVVSPETVTQRIRLLRQAIGDDAQSPRYVGLVRGGGYRLLIDRVDRVDPDQPLPRSLLSELNRRRVPQTALVYAAVAWTITEALTFVLETFSVFPSWSRAVVAIAFVAGFPVAMFLAWHFDLGSDGVQRSGPLVRGRRGLIYAAVGLMLVATAGLSYVLIQAEPEPPSSLPEPMSDVVALLPFTTQDVVPELQRLGSSLNDELRDSLRGLGLKMVARNSSRALEAQNLLITDIAEKLGAGTLIQGRVGQTNGRMVISMTLVDGTNGLERWSGRFQAAGSDLAALRHRIARAIARELDIEGPPDAQQDATDPEAFNLVLLGRHFEQQVTDRLSVDLGTLDRAIALYRQAVARDPNSSLALSRLAGALLYRGDVAGAKQPIFDALTLDPESADVQYTLGLYYWQTHDSRGGEAFARAVELDPNHADALSAHAKWIWHQQNFLEPLTWFERALEVDPLSLSRHADLGSFYAYQDDRDRTLRVAREVASRFRTPESMEVVARLHELTGDLDHAIAWAWKGRGMAAPTDAEPTWQLAELYARIGMPDVADQLVPGGDVSKYFWSRKYQQLIDVAEEIIIENPGESKVYYQLAFAYNANGQHAAAARLLRLAGLPDVTFADSRRADAVEALATYTSALATLGELEEARVAARWHVERMRYALETQAHNSWWPNLYLACQLMVLGDSTAALTHLQTVVQGSGLPWEPVVRDSVCFRPVHGDSAYRQVVDTLASRKEALRRRLSDTLVEHGIDPDIAASYLAVHGG